MIITLSWLKDHLSTSANLTKIIDKLTGIGLEVEGIKENPVQIPTDDNNKVYTIAEIVDPGYKIDSDEITEIIKPATVKIFVQQNKNKEE